ncbi:hypothetical protein QBC34DRAFT_1684 [Podospora aff. communis PSN243]|uniref:Uncharacterized protein n=1 Tax=Podospora aff. communis PSN243 TaxID=3040156 RepID=A0AAV9H7F2_9PEZI|nr:hypothetical protein QBC34DRAFT_1684 [Podospora aff. communis PSN243]
MSRMPPPPSNPGAPDPARRVPRQALDASTVAVLAKIGGCFHAGAQKRGELLHLDGLSSEAKDRLWSDLKSVGLGNLDTFLRAKMAIESFITQKINQATGTSASQSPGSTTRDGRDEEWDYQIILAILRADLESKRPDSEMEEFPGMETSPAAEESPEAEDSRGNDIVSTDDTTSSTDEGAAPAGAESMSSTEKRPIKRRRRDTA